MAARFHSIIGIFTSSHLNASYANAVEAANIVRGKTDIKIIDSQTISVGLGFLVETAAEAAFRGKSPLVIEETGTEFRTAHLQRFARPVSLTFSITDSWITPRLLSAKCWACSQCTLSKKGS
jgi:hypothetical protein